MLREKVAIVTGGARGIGLSISNKMSEMGARVAIFGTNSERGKRVVEGLRDAKFYQVDVSSAQEVEGACQQVLEDFGSIDILVNNAGITKDGLLMKMKEADWDAVINVNLKSLYHTCKSVIRPMMKARRGKIINITSVVGLSGNAGQTNYAASKAGMIGFTKSLAKEVASRGIQVNCVAPGFIVSDMTDALNERQKEGLLATIPMGHLGKPENVADAVFFLASPLSDYVTGQILTVDGGMVM